MPYKMEYKNIATLLAQKLILVGKDKILERHSVLVLYGQFRHVWYSKGPAVVRGDLL
jgi:hypothetical protein